MEQQVKRVPYGVSDFKSVIEQNQYYVDKTMFLVELEKQPSNLFFIRPRRFGKSIFLSMLYSYYDCNQKDKFDELFGNLWIGQHPTPLQGTYQVLFLDFSQITSKLNRLEERFNAYMNIAVDCLVRRYSLYYQEDMDGILSQKKYADKLELLTKAATRHNYQLYLLVDDYDDFANVMYDENCERINHAISYTADFYRDVFKNFNGKFSRMFLIGNSPVSLEDTLSDKHDVLDISCKPEFDEMLGFSSEDVFDMFAYYKEMGCISVNSDVKTVVGEFKQWYANYQFDEKWSNKQVEMFNVIFVYYFYWEYSSTGKVPSQCFDSEHRDVTLRMM